MIRPLHTQGTFYMLGNENKRRLRRHLFSHEHIRNKHISRNATTSAKQMVFMSDKERNKNRRREATPQARKQPIVINIKEKQDGRKNLKTETAA